MQLVRTNNTLEHREQTAQREQTQQVELRGGFLKRIESYYPCRLSVYKNPLVLTVGSFQDFYIFFAPNNASSDTLNHYKNGNLPTENSSLYVSCCFITLLNILFFDSI